MERMQIPQKAFSQSAEPLDLGTSPSREEQDKTFSNDQPKSDR